MGKKKEPSIQDSLTKFKEVMKRSSLSSFIQMNNMFISKNNKAQSILISIDRSLLSEITIDDELKDYIRELNMNNITEYNEYISLFKFADDLDSDLWISLDVESIFNGKIVYIKVHDKWEYEIPIGRSLLPLKLRKSEVDHVSYRVFQSVENDKTTLKLGLKKKFELPFPDSNFTLMRMFKIY